MTPKPFPWMHDMLGAMTWPQTVWTATRSINGQPQEYRRTADRLCSPNHLDRMVAYGLLTCDPDGAGRWVYRPTKGSV